MSEHQEGNERHETVAGDGAPGSPATAHPAARGFRRAALTKISGVALADMGLSDPDVRLLEPIARTIHELATADREEEHH